MLMHYYHAHQNSVLQTSASVTRRKSSLSSRTPNSSRSTRRAPGCIWRNRRSSSNTYSSSWRKKIKEHKPVQHPQQEIIWNIHRTENENAYELRTTLPIKISGLQTSDSACHNPCIQLIYPMTPDHPHGQDKPEWLKLEYCRSSPNTNFSFWLSNIPRNTNHRWPLPNKSEINLSSYNKAPRTPDKCQPTHQNYRRSLDWNFIIFNNRWLLHLGHQEEVLNVKFQAKRTGKHSIKTQRFQVYVFDLKPKWWQGPLCSDS